LYPFIFIFYFIFEKYVRKNLVQLRKSIAFLVFT
jgi:hypothetical protein